MNSEVKITDEENLLLGLCRLEFSDEQIIKIMDLVAVVDDWNYFSSLANAHGVAALVYHNLERNNLLNGIPEEVVTYLRGALMRSLSRNAFNTESLGEVLPLLNKEKIRTVLLKGLAMELTVYGNEGLRQMSDVDILISRNQCIKAREILISNGFVSLPVKSIFHKFIIADTGKHLPSLIKNGTSVEIHHELFGTRKNGLTRMLYDNSYKIMIKGEEVSIPPPQIFFLYLIKHLYLHEMNNESQLRLYTDLVVLISKHRNEIINHDLLTYASQAGMSEILAWHLEPLRDLWGVTFPGWIDDFIKGWYDPDSINKFIFFLKSPKNNPPLDKPSAYRHKISEIPGVHRKFLYLLGDLFPTFSFMKKRYHCTSKWKVLF
ncbi:MAG: nucleotidyltransferase family protein, partial [Bacteroidales bacterium]|nr:nucleotidyltransferase family protein [Bacteroidales bacterium]